jgi:hypothetical protein
MVISPPVIAAENVPLIVPALVITLLAPVMMPKNVPLTVTPDRTS